MYKRELEIAKLAGPLGFNGVRAVEHRRADHTLRPKRVEMLCCPAIGDIASAAHAALEKNLI